MTSSYRAKPVTPGSIVKVPVPSPSVAGLIERIELELKQERERRAARVREALERGEVVAIVEYGFAIEM